MNVPPMTMVVPTWTMAWTNPLFTAGELVAGTAFGILS